VPSLDARAVARLLREYAQRTALRGGNPYRAKAYGRAADSLRALAVPLHVLVAEDRLTEIPGVGDAIADIITKLSNSGTHPSLEKLRKEIPEGVLELLAVPGLCPEKVLRLYQDLGITSLAELEAAVEDDRVKKAKGLGAALQTKILQLAVQRTQNCQACQERHYCQCRRSPGLGRNDIGLIRCVAEWIAQPAEQRIHCRRGHMDQ
jgi:DNA polymerase (family 10)